MQVHEVDLYRQSHALHRVQFWSICILRSAVRIGGVLTSWLIITESGLAVTTGEPVSSHTLAAIIRFAESDLHHQIVSFMDFRGNCMR